MISKPARPPPWSDRCVASRNCPPSVHEKSVRALKKKDQTRADRLRRTRDALLPGGSFQERGLGLLSLLARYGTAVIGEIAERVDLWAKGHQVIQL